MFSLLIEETLKGIGAPILTDIFIILIVAAFAMALISTKAGRMRRFTSYAPTLLTSLGILGTFAGIISGLLEFDSDPQKIDKSIQLLLEGLKTAFISSLVGMSASIFYKVIVALPFMAARNPPSTKESIGAYELFRVMQTNTEILESIQYALGGNTAASVSNQLTLVRHQSIEYNRDIAETLSKVVEGQRITNMTLERNQELFQEFQSKLWQELQDFATMLSESASKHVIEALNQVISDFNINLTEQFGDNFKLLNEAVAQLIAWQAEYKEQIQQMNAQYQHGVKAITETNALVANIESSSQRIPENMEKMSSTMTMLQSQLNDVESHVKRMGDLHQKAEAMHPEFKKRLEEIVQATSDANQTMTTSMKNTSSVMVSSASEFQDRTKATFDDMNSASKKMFDGMQLSIETSLQKNTDSMNTHFKKMDEAQGQEIARVAERMGQALTSITGHFTSDYKKLVDAMQQIVQYGNRG